VNILSDTHGGARPDEGRSILVEIVFDPACPWCYIGKRRLERALAMRPDLRPVLKWWPFLLNPEMPDEGIDRTTYLVRKYGSETRVGRIYGAIAEVGQSVEIDFAFDRIRRAPSTVNAHRLVRFAAARGLADAVVEALFFGYFISARDVGAISVLVDIGAELGLDAAALKRYLESDEDVALIYEENARAHRLGVNGVPSFVFGGFSIISGAQEPKVLARMLDVTRLI
jgi:predicted DsbA family dithiol-disulfide isomerase